MFAFNKKEAVSLIENTNTEVSALTTSTLMSRIIHFVVAYICETRIIKWATNVTSSYSIGTF